MKQTIRLRSFRTKKEKKTVPNDDDVPWVQAAMLGLQVGKVLLGASGKASSSRAGKHAVDLQLQDINESLANLTTVASSKKEVGIHDYKRSITNISDSTSELYTDIHRDQDSIAGTSGFAVDMQLEEKFKVQEEKVSDKYVSDRSNLSNNLDKYLADVDEWQVTEESKLKSQKRQLRAKRRYYSQTDNFLGALIG